VARLNNVPAMQSSFEDGERILWERYRHQGKSGFIWRTVIAKVAVPLTIGIGLLQFLKEPGPSWRVDLLAFAASAVVTLAVMLPVAYLWASRFWDRCEAKWGGGRQKLRGDEQGQ
jgi:hypothetical protein